MTREAFETALDQGRLWTCFGSRPLPQWYVCRRNGRTKTWKRDPSRFEVPVKFRFRDCARIEARHFDTGVVDQYFRISKENPNEPQARAHRRAQGQDRRSAPGAVDGGDQSKRRGQNWGRLGLPLLCHKIRGGLVVRM